MISFTDEETLDTPRCLDFTVWRTADEASGCRVQYAAGAGTIGAGSGTGSRRAAGLVAGDAMRMAVVPGDFDVLLEIGQSRLRPGDIAGLQGAANGLKILADAAAAIEQARAAGGLRGGLDLLLQGGISALRAGQIARLQGAGQGLEVLRLLLD